MLQRPPEVPPPSAPGWMVTFADLMSLLLTFFVLMLSFSSSERAKFETMAQSMRGAFGLEAQAEPSDEGQPAAASPGTPPEAMTMVRLREALEKTQMEDAATIDVVARGVSLRLDGDVAFESGRVELKAEALPLLERLVEIAATAPGIVEVEGHTDDVPIHSDRFESNWELSGARAGSAVRWLVAHGVPAVRLRAIGYADTAPLGPNTSPENRARNRRVEFLFVTDAHGEGGQP